MNIMVCAGGTGGGIYPALAAVSELESLGIPKEQILWIGVKGEMEENIIPRAGIPMRLIPGGGLAGLPLFKRAINVLKLGWATLKSYFLMGQFKPDAVLLTGGYMSVPVAFAAKARSIPSVVYLPDLEPGSAIQFISKRVDLIAATFEESAEYFDGEKPLTATGYPLRPQMVEASQICRNEAVERFGLNPDEPVLFVFGGSRGAWSINQALMQNLESLLQSLQIIHISGTLTWDVVEEHADTLPEELRARYKPFPYLHDRMGVAFRSADLVVARAGASMLGEAPLFGTPTILVPYPHAWRYQKINADYLANRGAAEVLPDEELETHLATLVTRLLDDRTKLEEMGQAAHALHTPNAARNLAQAVFNLANTHADSRDEDRTE